MTEDEIHKTCKQYKIENYKINPDMSIDVNGSVEIGTKNLHTLPAKFNIVSGDFICSTNRLTTLEGCPKYVGGDFYSMNISIGSPMNYSRLLFIHVEGVIEPASMVLQEFFNNNKNPPKKDLPRLLSELRRIQL